MPFDYPEEEQDDVEAPTQKVQRTAGLFPARRVVSGSDPSSARFPNDPANGLNDAQFQRLYEAPPTTISKPGIGQRIVAMGQWRGPFDTEEGQKQDTQKDIGERIVQMGRQPMDSSPVPRLSPISGASSSQLASNDLQRGQANLQPNVHGLSNSFSGDGGFHSLSQNAGLRQRAVPSSQRPPVTNATSPKSDLTGAKQQQNQDRRMERTTDEQDGAELPPPTDVFISPKVKPPQDAAPGVWSGGEAAPGQPIVKSGYHTDYPARGKRKIGGDRGWRNNNPGNIKYSRTSPACKYAIGSDYGGFAVFDTMQDGIRAQDTLWRTPMYQNMTLRQAVLSWTKNDPPETQQAYLQDLMDKTRVTADTKVLAFNESQLQRLQESQRKHEGGRKGKIVDIPKPKSTGNRK
ncbi:MAG TPA: hypothetical protein VKD65_10800 [Candidatus Angelobacter sp.]|nr:hypothetical protein [Candidatus Angelobacter sp.]